MTLSLQHQGRFGAEGEDEVEDGEVGDESEAVGANLPVAAPVSGGEEPVATVVVDCRAVVGESMGDDGLQPEYGAHYGIRTL